MAKRGGGYCGSDNRDGLGCLEAEPAGVGWGAGRGKRGTTPRFFAGTAERTAVPSPEHSGTRTALQGGV